MKKLTYKCADFRHQSFIIEVDDQVDLQKYVLEAEVKCPECGSIKTFCQNQCRVCGDFWFQSHRISTDDKGNETCLHDSPSIGTTDKREALRQQNRTATRQAQDLARSAQDRDRIENPDVVLAPIDKPGNRSPYTNTPITVKKNVLDSLTEKGSQILSE